MKKATHQLTRTHNTRLVLKHIYDSESISRAEIARRTGLTRASVSSIMAELIDKGLVAEVGRGPSVGGKPPVLVSLVADARYLLGLDLANGSFHGRVYTLRGTTVAEESVPVDNSTGEGAETLVYELIDSLVDDAVRARLLGIGIGAPGLVDAKKGVVRESVRLGWRQLALGERVRRRFDVPVRLANDCHAAAMAEYTFGETRKSPHLVVLKVGRGTGAGFVINGSLHYGDGFAAGEIGHVVFDEAGELCECGKRGCLEALISNRAIVRQARAIAAEQPSSILNRLASSPDEVTIEMVHAAVQRGAPELEPVVTQTGRYVGMVIANLVGVLNIRRIVIAGTVAQFGELLLASVVEELDKRSLPALVSGTSVTLSSLGMESVTLGAASLLLSQELGVV